MFGGQPMVSEHDLHNKIYECKKQFYEKIEHSYLQQFVHEPIVDEDRLRFLFAMLDNVIPEKELHVLALSMLLVEAALETHEEVSLHDVNTDFFKKNRQLTVLAGDYYSSLYYFLLANIGHIPMIRLFSKSIQEINEAKMAIYQENLSFESVVKQIYVIESSLLQSIASYYHLTAWKHVTEEYFYLKRLVKESEHIQEANCLPLIRGLINSNCEYKEFGSTGNIILEELGQLCNQKISESEERLLKLTRGSKEITFFIESLLKKLHLNEIVMEEG